MQRCGGGVVNSKLCSRDDFGRGDQGGVGGVFVIFFFFFFLFFFVPCFVFLVLFPVVVFFFLEMFRIAVMCPLSPAFPVSCFGGGSE